MTRNSLKQKVYKSLRLDIISGRIPGGTRITETDVADTLNVSRTPVREALQKLAQERLLTAIPKSGYMVENLSDNEIQDLFTTRMEVEQIAIQKAIQNITPEELKLLDDNLEKTKAAIKAKEDLKVTELDLEFHLIIYRAARSQSLFWVCKNLSDLTIKYRHGLNLIPNLWSELLQQHIRIYQAILSKDTDKSVRELTRHGDYARTHVLKVMQKIRSDAFSPDSL